MFVEYLLYAKTNASSFETLHSFVVDVFTGDRASDLGRLQCCNVYKLRDWEGYLLRSTLAKNIHCAGSPPIFRLEKWRGSKKLCAALRCTEILIQRVSRVASDLVSLISNPNNFELAL